MPASAGPRHIWPSERLSRRPHALQKVLPFTTLNRGDLSVWQEKHTCAAAGQGRR